jgi:hypothetical protein
LAVLRAWRYVRWSHCPLSPCSPVAAVPARTRATGGTFAFNETYDGSFSPDGSLLAVPVTVTGREPAVRGGSDGIALVDVRAGSVDLIEESRSGVYTALAWSPAGDWLFFVDGERRIMAYRPGAARAIVLPAEVPDAVLDMVAR